MRKNALLTRQSGRLGGLPWPARLVLGLVPLALGAAVVLRPFDSLTWLIVLIAACLLIEGALRMLTADRSVSRSLAGLVLVAAGVFVIAWPEVSVDMLAVVVGVSMVVNGLHDVAAGWSARGRARGASLMSGAAWLIFGLLALVWPDVAILVIAIVFGLRMIAFGIGVVVGALRDAHARRGGVAANSLAHTAPVSQPEPGVLSLVGRGLLLALAGLLLAASIQLHRDQREPGPFYSAPASIPAEPGRLIRSDPYTQGIPDGSRAKLILYTTTGLRGEPRVGSAFVIVPERPAAEPREVVLWTHGTEGSDAKCAPTLLPEPQPLVGPVAAMRQELAKGRVVVGPDYPGLGTSGRQGYLIGADEGRSALDAVRAAHQLSGLRLADETVVWGHSQGGQAALWTGMLAPRYAPDVKLVGVAAAAPASDLPALVTSAVNSTVGQVLGAFVMRSYSETYADVNVDDYVDPRVQTIYRAMSRRCLPAKATLVSVLSVLTLHGSIFSRDPGSGPLGRRLAENVPRGPVAAPVFIAQGSADQLVLPTMQDGYVEERCAAGQRLLYRKYPGKDHLSVVADDSPYIPDLVAWTQDRFDGVAQDDTCG